MAKKISELTTLSTADNSDILVINDVSENDTMKITKQNLLKEVNSNIENLSSSIASLSSNAIVDSSYEQTGYIKFASGLMFQWLAYNPSVTMSTTGSVAYGDATMPNWDQPFTTIHFALPTCTNKIAWCSIGDYNITSAGTVRIYRPTTQSGTYYVRVFAVGRWKEPN